MSSFDTQLPKSLKNVWFLLSGTALVKSREFIGTELSKNGRHIIEGLKYYKPLDAKDNDILKCKIPDDIPIKLMEKMSVLLNVNISQCYELFCSYLLYEYKGTPQSVKLLFSSEKHTKNLLHSLWDYYYSERLFGLLCLKQILSNWVQSAVHPYRELFRSFLEKTNDDNRILNNLIGQLEYVCTNQMEAKGPYFNEELAKRWHLNCLKEKCEILMLLLIYFKHFEVNTQNILKLLSIFRSKTSHLSTGRTIGINETPDESVYKFIHFLQSLVIIESFDLKWLLKCQEQDISEHHLLKDANALKELDSEMLRLNSSVQHNAPVFLSWMCVRSWELPQFDASISSNVVRFLANNALQLNVFNYLNDLIQFPHFNSLKDTVVLDIIYGVIGDLLSVTFTLYNIDESVFTTSSLGHLHELFTTLFKNNRIANDLYVNGLDDGFGLIIRSVLCNYPLQTESVLNFCCSLSETNSCSNIFEELTILSNVTTYTELFEMSPLITPTQQDSVYTLIGDKLLYRNREIMIKKGTIGYVREFNKQTVIEWRNVNIDGWKLLYYRYKYYLDLIIRGQTHAIEDNALREMTQIAILCSNLIQHRSFRHISAFTDLISLPFNLYDIFSLHQNPPRTIMASVLELATAVIKQTPDYSLRMWQRVTEKKFLPYMIGLINDIKEVSLGKDTHSSTIGEIIASEECIRGDYELCKAYLKFIVEAVNVPNLRNDDFLLASVIYIINEIFPAHNGWNYMKLNDSIEICRLCYTIFHSILNSMNKVGNHSKLEQICMTALLENSASEKLLITIKTGESIVRNAIIDSGSDTSLNNNDAIIIVRKSLFILDRLIAINSYPKVLTSVEKALFSSDIKPNMLLILSYYVFQRYDSQLAASSVSLLKRLSKRFPMSMLACMGSDADSIRDHFLMRLGEVTEDLRLKVELLGFISTCVKHQAGLMELFLNIDSDNNDSTTGCLYTVLEILEEKRDGKYYCPFELHCAALKFLYTFWLQPHLLAIDSLKKTANVWTLITFPIFEKENGVFNDKLCSFVLRILAREIFYVKTLERDKFDCDLENKFKILKESDTLKQLSKHICKSVDFIRDDHDDSYRLLNSWKDFVISIAKFDPFALPNDIKIVIMDDLLNCYLRQIKNPIVHRVTINSLIEIIFILLQKWKDSCISDFKEWNIRNIEILNALNEEKENFPFSLMISSNLFLTQFIEITENSSFNRHDLVQWTSPVCNLVNYSLRIVEKQIKLPEKSCTVEFRLTVVTITMLRSLLNAVSDCSLVWLKIIRNNAILESFENLLLYLIKHRIGLELANSVMYLLITLSSIASCAEVMHIIGITDNMCIALQITYIKENENIKLKYDDLKYSWRNVFHLSLKLFNGMLNSLNHYFVDSAISFVAIHFDHIRSVLSEIRAFPAELEVIECTLIISLLQSLSKFIDSWKCHHNASLDAMCIEVSKTCNSLTAFLLKPALLADILEHPHHAPVALSSNILTPKKISPKEKIEERGLRKSSSFDPEIFSRSLSGNRIYGHILKFQAFSLAFIKNTTPDIIELMEKQGIADYNCNLIISKNFSGPTIGHEQIISFGSLICCIEMCIKALSKNDRTLSSDSKEQTTLNHVPILTYIFEKSLSLLVSQALIALLTSSITRMEKEEILRELSTEINSTLSPFIRHPKRTLSQSSILNVPKIPTINVLEQRYVRLLLRFIEKLSQ